MAWDKRGDQSFTWRGGEVSRLEGFSDAVFGFALTLLVVSMEVSRTFDQLVHAMKGFFGFAFCFIMLLGVWAHRRLAWRRGRPSAPATRSDLKRQNAPATTSPYRRPSATTLAVHTGSRTRAQLARGMVYVLSSPTG